MARGVNKVILLGNVGRDPEVGTTRSDETIATFSLATTEKAKDGERTEWHSIVCFGRMAEVVRDYIGKGAQVYIEGRIQTRSWDDQQSGQKRYRTEIIANELTVVGGLNRAAPHGHTA